MIKGMYHRDYQTNVLLAAGKPTKIFQSALYVLVSLWDYVKLDKYVNSSTKKVKSINESIN